MIDLSGVSAENKQIVATVLRQLADALDLASAGDKLEIERFWNDPRHDEDDDTGGA